MIQIRYLPGTGDVVRLECAGEITQFELTPGVDPIEAAAGPLVYRHRALLNLEKTSYVDSSGIGWLLAERKKFEHAGGRLVLHSVPPVVLQVLHMMRLTNVFTLAGTEREALDLVAEAKA